MSPDLQKSRKRLVTMFVIDTVAIFVAGGAATGAFVYGIDWLKLVFVGAIAVGVGIQIWFIAGFRPGRGA